MSVRDTIVLSTSLNLMGPSGQVSFSTSRSGCTVEDQGVFLFTARDTGVYQVFFESRSFGPLSIDTCTITVTDQPPSLIVGAPEVTADMGSPMSFGLTIQDDGAGVRVYYDLDGDNAADTVCQGAADHQVRFMKPTKNGEKKGVFTVHITVADNDSHVVADSARLTVYYRPPQADAGSNIIACPNQPVALSAAQSRDGNGRVTRYAWDFSQTGRPDTIAAVPDMAWIFDKPRDYLVQLLVADNHGNLSKPDTLYVSIMDDKPETAIDGDTETRVGESVQFHGRASSNCSEIERYQWDFDNNGSWDYSSRVHGRAAHTYTAAGMYLARFRVVDSKGDSAAQVRKVMVNP